jgi:hypothetical protein
MNRTAIILAIALVGTTVSLGHNAAADDNSCSTTSTTVACVIHCHPGQTLHVKVEYWPAEPVEGRVSCGGATAYCLGWNGHCEAASLTTALGENLGRCALIQGGMATCWTSG